MTPPSPAAAPKILLVGDVMLDRYFAGSVDRISPEAPVPVLHVRL
jgi:bifunctional ADP-heptose synthase (sugar kinase/adenylyltransferase)